MSADAKNLRAIEEALAAQLDRCRALLDRARDDEAALAVRDLLLDLQFESRALITAAEERLGAYDDEQNPRAIAAHAEALVEGIEAQQDAWEARIALLLDAGVDEARPVETLAGALDDPERRARLEEFFAGLPGDLDQAGEFLEYAKRYLLSLIEERSAVSGRRSAAQAGAPPRSPDVRPRRHDNR